MKKKFITTAILMLLTIITVIYSFSLTNLYALDEIWNYGFAKNILDGLIPYKDFNMIIPPLFPYLLSIILKIFGEKLIVYYIFVAIIVSTITYLSYKKIGIYAISIYLLLLVYSTNGYNTVTLLLLFLLLLFLDKKAKHKDIIIPIIIGLMVLSKQTMALLIIPSIYYSKQKKKSILTYTIIFLIFLIYLVTNNNLLEFIDYCFLGMFEFTEKNHTSVFGFLLLEIVACIFLLYNLIKSKGKNKEAFYVLMYQIIVFPIVDLNHFILGFVAAIYIFFLDKGWTSFIRKSAFIVILTIGVAILFIGSYTTTFRNRHLLEHSNENNFAYKKLMPIINNQYISQMEEYINMYPNHKLYILGNYSYLVKLSLDIPINKYDLINNGNMGYKGADKYIKEIKNTCKKEKCLFIVNDGELRKEDFMQTNIKILEYVTSTYTKEYASYVFGVYVN